MIKLKNKPNSCENCPFCYKSSDYDRVNGKIETREKRHCGVMRESAEYEKCPLA